LLLSLVHLRREAQIKSLWTKKNPYLSMWLSGANAVVGSARSRAAAEGRRQAAIITTISAKQIAGFWSRALTTSSSPKKKKTNGVD
jgi:hypothetical protein